MDLDGNGVIEISELQDAIKKYQNNEKDTTELQAIIDEMDYHGNKVLNYNEFLTATIGIKQFKDAESARERL